MPEFLQSAIAIFFATVTTWGILYILGKRKLEMFPDLESVRVLFMENRASGFSKKSFMTKRGGANKMLQVIITNRELWIRSHAMHATFAKKADLLHKVRLDRITSINEVKKNIEVTFQNSDRSETTVSLKLKKPEDFTATIRENTELALNQA